MHTTKLVVDSRLNKWTDREAANLLVLPDEARWPVATCVLLNDQYDEETHVGESFSRSCLHPALAPFFATLALVSQSVATGVDLSYMEVLPPPESPTLHCVFLKPLPAQIALK